MTSKYEEQAWESNSSGIHLNHRCDTLRGSNRLRKNNTGVTQVKHHSGKSKNYKGLPSKEHDTSDISPNTSTNKYLQDICKVTEYAAGSKYIVTESDTKGYLNESGVHLSPGFDKNKHSMLSTLDDCARTEEVIDLTDSEETIICDEDVEEIIPANCNDKNKNEENLLTCLLSDECNICSINSNTSDKLVNLRTQNENTVDTACVSIIHFFSCGELTQVHYSNKDTNNNPVTVDLTNDDEEYTILEDARYGKIKVKNLSRLYYSSPY